MKFSYKYSLIGAFLLLFASCENFIDLAPISQVGENGFYSNTSEINAAVVSCYDGLQTSVQFEFVLTEVRSDNATTLLGEGEFEKIDKFTEDATNSQVLAYWQNSYSTIARANIVLEYIDVVDNADLKKQYEGEAKFIRALNHFNLVRLFGDVPLITKRIGTDEVEMFKRVSKATVYQAIIDDLKDAANLLPAKSASAAKGRATAGAAKALLAKVYLTTGDYAAAKAQLDAVISSGTFGLETDYATVLAEDNELNDEILFAVQFQSNSNGEGQRFSYEFTSKGQYSGLNNATPEMLAAYDAADLRKATSVTGDKGLCNKFPLTASTPTDAGNDWVVLRYADVLLMRAEAILAGAASTTDATALADVNAIRSRAGLTELTTLTATDLWAERKLELAFENQRWFDLLRSGKAVEAMAAQGITISASKLVYPIPQREIDVSEGVLTQN